MIDLEREVSAWSAAVYAARCRPEASAAELIDHLHCEIERLRDEGLSEEEAFRVATERLGNTSSLAAEHDKNLSVVGAACQIAAKIEPTGIAAEDRRFLMAHAVVWSALMIATAVVARKTERELSGWLLVGVLIPLYWVSEQLLRAALRKRAVDKA